MNLMTAIETYCQGTAESESRFLSSIYVDSGVYREVFQSSTGKPVVLIGRKGTGKSALLAYMAQNATLGKLKYSLLKPDNFDLPPLDKGTPIASIKRQAYDLLIGAIAVSLGNDLRGLLNRSNKKLFDQAVKQGVKGKDFVQSVLGGLSAFGSAVTTIDFGKLVPGMSSTKTEELKRSIQANLGSENKGNLFLLLIDDIDQVASLSTRDELNRIWAFLLAVKKLAEDFQNIKVVITLRTEVWRELQKDDAGQRDQVDHFQRLLKFLDPNDEEIKQIVTRRIEIIQGAASPAIELFGSKSVILPTTEDDTRSWPDFLAISSRNRPRDAIQFLGILGDTSRRLGFDQVQQESVAESSLKYSKEKFNELDREFALDCPNLKEILLSFRDVDFKIPTEPLRLHLSKLPSRFGITVRGKSMKPDDLDGCITLWSFLFETGFFSARVNDARAPRGFRHLRFEEAPDFVTNVNWNEMQKVDWEIHPAYRSELLKLKEDERSRGLFSKMLKKPSRT